MSFTGGTDLLQRKTSIGRANNPNLQEVRVATAACCQCSEFAIDSDHLRIELKRVELKLENAIALSYTWGEFDRRVYCIGHVDCQTSRKVLLNLGLEWDVEAFKKRLVELSARYKSFWMDQICIVQKEDDVRKTLAAIPSIYRTLDVIALFPGALCRCLINKNDVVYRNGNINLSQEKEQPVEAFMDTQCLNATGICSYFNRVWTFQEFTYSRCIRILWNIDKSTLCVLLNAPESEMIRLSPFAYLTYRALRAGGQIDHDEAVARLRSAVVDFGAKAWTWAFPNRSDADPDGKMVATRFLLGHPLRHREPDRTFGGIISPWHSLGELRTSATQNKDYVLSAWVNWTEYQIPKNFSDLTAFDLFRDGLQQLQDKLSVFIPSHCPNGLMLSVPNGTFHWHFPTDQITKDITDSRALYGLFSWENNIAIPSLGKLPLKHTSGSERSVWNRTWDIRKLLVDLGVKIVVEVVCEAIQTWDKAIGTRLLEDFAIAGDPADRREPECALEDQLTDTQRAAYVKDSLISLIAAKGKPEVMFGKLTKELNAKYIERALYEIVCEALHLDVAACLSRDLELVMACSSPEDEVWNKEVLQRTPMPTCTQAPCIGIARLEEWRKNLQEREPTSITIALPRMPQQPYYEAVRVPATRPPEYRVFGVWVPTVPTVKVSGVGAVFVQRSDFNAFLV